MIESSITLSDVFEGDLDRIMLEMYPDKNGSLSCIASVNSNDELFDEAAKAHCASDAYITLWLRFPVSRLLDSIISDAGEKGIPSVDEKPVVDQLRADLLTLVARIDGLVYGPSAADELD